MISWYCKSNNLKRKHKIEFMSVGVNDQLVMYVEQLRKETQNRVILISVGLFNNGQLVFLYIH